MAERVKISEGQSVTLRGMGAVEHPKLPGKHEGAFNVQIPDAPIEEVRVTSRIIGVHEVDRARGNITFLGFDIFLLNAIGDRRVET